MAACAVCRRGTWGTRSAQELSTASSLLALRELEKCFPLILQWPPSPFPLWPLHGPCSFRSLKDNARFSKKRGKKRAPVSKHCLFAGGTSKKKHLINQNRQERLLFFRELAYLSSLTPSLPSSFALCQSKRSEVRGSLQAFKFFVSCNFLFSHFSWSKPEIVSIFLPRAPNSGSCLKLQRGSFVLLRRQ